MADITDARVVAWSNAHLRPTARLLRRLYIRAKDAELRWSQEVGGLVANTNADKLIDGRASQGVSVLTGQDLYRGRKVIKDFIDWYEGGVLTPPVTPDGVIEGRLALASVGTVIVGGDN